MNSPGNRVEISEDVRECLTRGLFHGEHFDEPAAPVFHTSSDNRCPPLPHVAARRQWTRKIDRLLATDVAEELATSDGQLVGRGDRHL